MVCENEILQKQFKSNDDKFCDIPSILEDVANSVRSILLSIEPVKGFEKKVEY